MVAPSLRQAWTLSAVLLNMVGQGMLISYSSSFLPALKKPDSPIKVDSNTASLIASCIGVAGIPGFFISAFFMAKYGRKIAHAIIMLPGTTGWTLIYFATNVPMLLTGRILGGITAGGTVALGAVVIGEYSSPEHRGMFLNLKTASVCLGGMIVHILSNFFEWRTIAAIALIPYFLAFIIILTWPESPAWLISKKQFDKSEKAFFWLRGKCEKSIRELDDMTVAQKYKTVSEDDSTFLEKTVEIFKKFTRKDFLMPLLIVFCGAVLLEASGRHIIQAYAFDIVGEITGNKTQSFFYTLALDIIITASATSSSILVKFMKRRTLLFSTGFSAVVVIFIACTYLFLASRDIISKDHTWIPISILILYFILVNLGCTPIPLALLGEIFPLGHRGVGSCMAGIIFSIGVSAGIQITSHLLFHLKVHGTFAIFGVTVAVSLLILYIILPETKDRTLQEIEDYFNYGRFRDDEKVRDDEDVDMKMLEKTSVR